MEPSAGAARVYGSTWFRSAISISIVAAIALFAFNIFYDRPPIQLHRRFVGNPFDGNVTSVGFIDHNTTTYHDLNSLKRSNGSKGSVGSGTTTPYTRSASLLVESNIDGWISTMLKEARKHNRKITFLQVGANDGIRNDPLFPHINNSEHEWIGMMIEPGDDNFAKLLTLHGKQSQHGWAFIKGAVKSKCDGEFVDFYEFKGDMNMSIPLFWKVGQANTLKIQQPQSKEFLSKVSKKCIDDLNALVRNHAAKSPLFRSMLLTNSGCMSWNCSCQGLSNLAGIHHMKTFGNASSCQRSWWGFQKCKTNPNKRAAGVKSLENVRMLSLDLLQIDVEGLDYEVMQALDFDKLRPKLVSFENVVLARNGEYLETMGYLSKKDYFVKHLSENSLAIDLRWFSGIGFCNN